MRTFSRRYYLAAVLVVGAVGMVIVFGFSGGRFTLSRLFAWESLVRRSIVPENPPDHWFSDRMQLLEELSRFENIADENERLREALGFYRRTAYEYAMANVVSRDPFDSSLIFLDAGSDDGVATGQPIVVGDGVLAGKIIRVNAVSSVGELITADSLRIAVQALDASSTSGLLRGTLGTGTRLEYIRNPDEIAINTTLVTSGLEPQVPKGLLVGTVQRIVDSPNTLFSYADILPAADLNDIRVVSIIKGL